MDAQTKGADVIFLKGLGGDGMMEAWEKYLSNLQESDPEEYKALMADLQTEMKRAQQPDIRSTEAEEEETFNPILPGGKDVMGEKGIESKKESQRIDPDPGFVLKTKDEKGQKVFINICKSDLIQKPSTKKQLAEDGTEQEGINVPLSLGPPRNDKDKSNNICLVYDIIVNPEIIDQMSDDKTGQTRSFLCNLALQYVEQKYKCKLDPKIKFPKLKYKGNMNQIPHQYIRKTKRPVIEEVDSAKENKSLNAASAPKKQTKPKKLEQIPYKLERKSADGSLSLCEAVLKDPTLTGNEVEKGLVLVLTADLSLVDLKVAGPAIQPKADNKNELLTRSLFSQIELGIGEEFLVLKVPKVYKNLEVYLPEVVGADNASAEFDASSGILQVIMPVECDTEKSRRWVHSTQPDPGSRPWLLSRAILQPDTVEKPKQKPQEVSEVTAEDPDELPEDKFHLNDMLSLHIKEERERQRKEKEKEAEQKQLEEKQKKEKEEREEKAKAKATLIKEVEEELKQENVGDNEATIVEDSDLLELF